MPESERTNSYDLFKLAAIVAAILLLYSTVLAKLGCDWWNDENYSHGLLVPFVIAFVIWSEWDAIKANIGKSSTVTGVGVVGVALLMLFAGTVSAELFTQRISMVLILAGLVAYFFGAQMLKLLVLPFALLLLAIPIPQIVFNRIAFPLQIWASQMAVWGIRLLDVPTVRKGNVIDILPNGSTQTISLEVVEACSGIRSLMTLVTLALVLGYFTRERSADDALAFAGMSRIDMLRTLILMFAAVPIAVLTNAARVSATGIMTYYYGKQATESVAHDASGWLVYVAALAILIAFNFGLKAAFRRFVGEK